MGGGMAGMGGMGGMHGDMMKRVVAEGEEDLMIAM